MEGIFSQRVLLVFATVQNDIELVEELKELVSTAGGEVVDVVYQNNEKMIHASAIGSGKVLEVAALVQTLNIDIVIFNEQLNSSQIKYLEDKIDAQIIDRTMLILDIFAQNANTAEGKLQVEVAQLKYMLPRLIGRDKSLSRLGGGIGTRGPGETKLETDRRLIKSKLTSLQRQLNELETKRSTTSKKRKKNEVFTVSVVGYTNAGKSTLFNRLTDSNVLSKDKLFATLDPTARKLVLPGGKSVLLIDTVGFIRNLPHELIAAFKSTLASAIEADLIINLCDISNPYVDEHNEISHEILNSLKCTSPIIDVYNKVDLIEDSQIQNKLCISAISGKGIQELLQLIEKHSNANFVSIVLKFNASEYGKINSIRQYGEIISQEYNDENIIVKAYIDSMALYKFASYIL